MGDEDISVVFHYAGQVEFIDNRFRYVGGNVSRLRLDIDRFSYFELVDYVWELDFYKKKEYDLYAVTPTSPYKSLGRKLCGLKLLKNDSDVAEVVKMYQSNNLVEIVMFVHVGPEIVMLSSSNNTSSIQSPLKALSEPIKYPTQPNSEPTLCQAQPNSPSVLQTSPSIPRFSKLTARKQCLPLIRPQSPIIVESPSSYKATYTKSTARRVIQSSEEVSHVSLDQDFDDVEEEVDEEEDTGETR